ncbi:unnamed protein product [Rhizoctonia solani]|uniref:Protein kinase domain-containing protein n=1 Tax=Rhizoctonia solani TaxID=456999 RepID=A0A8H3GXH7_9AGAM|nr:unnamed protein product [Rhizoctonia solani]
MDVVPTAADPQSCQHRSAYVNFVNTNVIQLENVRLLNGGQPLPLANCNARIIRASLLPWARQIGIKCVIKKSDDEEYKRQHSAHERELAVWCTLNNPNILPLSGTITLSYGYNTYMSPSAVFDFYEHGDITVFIRSRYQPDDLHRFRLLCEVAEGLSYLHSEGVIHGDIKSPNVVIDPSLKAKICDFGSAYIPNCLGCIAGSPGQFHSLKSQLYLSPELWADEDNDPPTTQESDVWALGCVMLEESPSFRFALCYLDGIMAHISQVQMGIPPYKTENDPYGFRTLQKRASGHPPAHINDFSKSNISAAIGVVALECWIREPEDRPSAQDVFEMLRETYSLFQAHL